MFILTNILYKKWIIFMVWIFSITLTKKDDFNQVIPSYEVAIEFSKGKEKTWYSNLAAKHLSHAKNKLTNSRLKYPTSRKVLFGTERLLGKTWVRLWFGNGKRIYLEHSHQQSTNYSIYHLKIYFIIYTIPFYNTPNIPIFIFLFYSLK